MRDRIERALANARADDAASLERLASELVRCGVFTPRRMQYVVPVGPVDCRALNRADTAYTLLVCLHDEGHEPVCLEKDNATAHVTDEGAIRVEISYAHGRETSEA
jgi:hypothetical protein